MERMKCMIQNEVGGGRVYRFWGGYRKVKYVKAPARSGNFWLCDLRGGCCEGN